MHVCGCMYRGKECPHACTFLCLCERVHLCICKCVHTHCAQVCTHKHGGCACLCAGTHTYACLRLAVYSCISHHVGASCAHVDVFVYEYVSVCTHTYMNTHATVCVYACLCACQCVYMPMSTQLCTYNLFFIEVMLIYVAFYTFHELPWWLSGEDSTCQCSRRRFDP